MGAPHPLLLPLLRGDDLLPDAEITMDVVTSAEEHFVAALVDQAVEDHDLNVPDHVRTRLAARAIAADAENLAAEAAASTVAGIAHELGIEIAIFKGLAIGQRFYAEPHRRPAIDVDIFVDPATTRHLGEFASGLGAADEDALAIDAMVANDRVFEAEFTVGDTMVDVHRDPMNMIVLATDEQDRWDRTVCLSLPDGAVVRTLDLEDTTIQALLNLFRDNFADLLHINDVRLVIGAGPDWDEVEQRAALNGWTDLIRFAAWFVTDRLGVPSPLPTRITRWRKAMIDSVWNRDLLLQGTSSHAQSLRRQSIAGILVSDRPSATTRAYLQRIAPPRAVIDHRSGTNEGSYPVALARWRLAQRRESAAFRDASYGDGE